MTAEALPAPMAATGPVQATSEERARRHVICGNCPEAVRHERDDAGKTVEHSDRIACKLLGPASPCKREKQERAERGKCPAGYWETA